MGHLSDDLSHLPPVKIERQKVFRLYLGKMHLEQSYDKRKSRSSIGCEIVNMVSLPDTVLDLLCNVAKDAVGAAWTLLYVFEGSNAVLIASSNGADVTLSKRIPIGVLTSPESAYLENMSDLRLPKQMLDGTYHSTNVYGDNAVIGHLVVGFAQTPFDMSVAHANMLRNMAQVISSRLNTEVVMGKVIRSLLGAIEADKQ